MSSGTDSTVDDTGWALGILTQIADVVFTMDLDGTVTWRRELNPGATGLTDSEVEGDQILDRVHPEDAALVLAQFDDLVAGRRRQAAVEFRIRRRRGSGRWYHNRVHASRLPDGQIICLSTVIDDHVPIDIDEPADPGFSIADVAPVGLALLGLGDLVVYANPAIRQLLGIAPGTLDGDDQIGQVVRSITADARRSGGHRLETTVDGRSVELRCHRIGPTDRPEVVLVVQDVTDLRALEAGKREADRLFATAFEHAPSGIALVGLDGALLEVNPAFAEITGYRVDELLQLDFRQITHPDDIDADVANVERVRRGLIRSYRMEKRYIRKDGHPVWVELRVSGACDEAGTLTHFISQIADITNRKVIEEQQRLNEAELTHRATHDLLTDLPNRALLDEHLHLLIARVRRESDSGAVLFCDLDGFKAVNDRFGHRVGDLTLIEAGHRLRGAIRDTDLVARIGGDEFIVALATADHPEAVARVADRIHNALTRPLDLPDGTVTVGASIGVTPITVDDDPGSVIHRADSLAYEAKRSGGGVRYQH